VVAEEPVVQLAAERSLFRAAEMVELLQLVERLRREGALTNLG
jgi:tryptophan synthase alpha subunit